MERWRFEERQCYYALSASGAAIGYALATVDDTLSLGDSRVVLAALALWAISLGLGVYLLRLLGLSQRLSVVSARQKIGSESEAKAFEQVFGAEDRKNGKRISRARIGQVVFLAVGALVYVFSVIDVAAALPIHRILLSTLP